MAQSRLREVLKKLQKNVAEVQAALVLGPDGLMDHVQIDPELKLDSIAVEYGTLLRIAGSASEDTGAGNLIEHIVISEKSVVMARATSPSHFLILVFRSQEQIGRARYELKQAARDLS